MSDGSPPADRPSNIDLSNISVSVPEPVPIVTEVRREVILQLVFVGLVLIDLGLVYILYIIFPRAGDLTALLAFEVAALLMAIVVIAGLSLRLAIHQYRTIPETIPEKDRLLLEGLIKDQNTRAIELYINLASLGGPTGTATKLGLTGLPLATIGLTIFFSIVALFVPSFLDLAKLTLGAFIGSFVQKSGEAIERAVRTQNIPDAEIPKRGG